MASSSLYTRARTCTLLGVNPKVLGTFVKKGYLLTDGRAGARAKFAKDWVDELAHLLAVSASTGDDDETMYKLYALHRAYLDVGGYTLSCDQRHRRRKKINEACQELAASNAVWTLQRTADAMQLPVGWLQRWARDDKMPALKFGKVRYVTAQYAERLITIWTTWKTASDLAEETGVLATTITHWARTQKIHGVRFMGGPWRIDPDGLKEFLSSRMAVEALTVDEAAQRMGCEKGTLKSRISDGIVVSVGEGANRRIPEEEVARWEKWFASINPAFEWLQPVLAQSYPEASTMTARQVCRVLEVGPSSLTVWSQLGLLPFFPASFIGPGRSVTRLFVRQYILALRRYAGAGKIGRQRLCAYKELCQEKGNIV